MVKSMQISWWVELSIRSGCLDEFEELTGEMVAATRAESGVLAYQRFISNDRRTVHVYERYEDSDAATAHIQKFAATFGKRYNVLVERQRFIVFGNPTDELRMLLEAYGATYHQSLGRFPHWG